MGIVNLFWMTEQLKKRINIEKNLEKKKGYGMMILIIILNIMSNVQRKYFFIITVFCSITLPSFAVGLDFIKEKCERLDSSKYFSEVNEIEKQAIPYILTECLWSNSQNTNKALVVLPHKQVKNVDYINCGDKEKFVAHLSTLISLGKNIGHDVISGIHVIPDSRPGLPHVYIRIIIFNGKEKLVLNLYEVHYIWNQRHTETNNKEINKINKFLREYIDILETYKAMKALDCFSPSLDFL